MVFSYVSTYTTDASQDFILQKIQNHIRIFVNTDYRIRYISYPTRNLRIVFARVTLCFTTNKYKIIGKTR